MALKKHGSTLITTIVLISLIGTVGSSILSLAVGDYKVRISDSEKLHNLYASDSGLDVAYDLMVSNFDMAGNFAKFKVEQLKNKKLSNTNVNAKKYYDLLLEEENLLNNSQGLTGDQILEKQKKLQEDMDTIINLEFKRNFKLFLFGREYANVYESEYVPNQLIDSITNLNYIVKMNKTGTATGEDLDPLKDVISESNFVTNSISIPTKPELTVSISSTYDKETLKKEDYEGEQKFTVTITSSFETSVTSSNSFTNKKEIEAKYNLTIPNYSDITFRTQESTTSNLAGFDDKGLTIFGNMQVKNTFDSNVTINGDVYVQGSMDKNLLQSNGEPYETYGDSLVDSSTNSFGNDVSTTHITEKYQGGITIGSEGKANITIDGNVITRNTFNISQNVDVIVTKDIYANNVYAGMPNGASGNNVNFSMNSGSMILNNDLTLKATNTNLSIENFYGVNDKNENNDTSEKKEQRSSSIIVNNKEDEKNTGIVIKNEAYIMGVAFIDTANSFQTGESTAIRGNYEAYTDGGDINDQEDTGDLTSKVNQFFNYWTGKSSDIKNGGIKFESINNIHSVGATVVNGQVQNATYTLDEFKNDGVINSKKGDYALNVYNLGENVSDKLSLYNNPTDPSAVKSNYFKIENMSDTVDYEKILSEGCIGLFNKNTALTVVIKGKSSSERYSDTSKYIVLEEKDLLGFIATNGNVIIDGEVNFSGNIIAGGNLILKGSEDINISYNPEIAQKLQKQNPEIFEKVFNVNKPKKEETTTNEGSIQINYDLDKFLKQALWQVKKN